MKLTKIAIALVAVLAMSAVVASGASAKELKSNAGVETVSIVGKDTGNHVFTVDGQNVNCTEANFATGVINVPAATTVNNAVYSGCTAFGFAGAKVEMGDCHYQLTTPVKLSEDEFTTEVSVTCNTENPGASTINVNASVFGSECSVSIGASNHTAHIIAKNTTSNNVADKINLDITVNNIKGNKNKDNGLCPLSGTGEFNNGSYNGGLEVSDVNGKDIFIEN